MNKQFLWPIMITLTFILIMGILTPICKAQLLDVTVYTNKVSYILDEELTIFGNLTFQGSLIEENGLVGLQIVDALGSPIAVRVVNVGPYTINPLVNILSVTPCDFYLNPKNSFERGEEAYFYVVAKNNDVTSHSVLMVATIFEGLNRPLSFPSTLKLTVNPGSMVGVRFGPVIIETWASSGEAKVYANVFSDWPKDQGFPYCPERSASFNIIGLEGDCSSSSESSSSQLLSYNSYTLTITLPPEAPSGQYRIHASASYRGFSAYSTRTFTILPGPYPPKAYFEYVPYPESWVGANMTFDASTSLALGYGDQIISYKWDFGDGTIVEKTTPKITKVYNWTGAFLVKLNVTDSEGFWNMTSKQITVLNERRDIAITQIESLTEIYADWIVNVTITIKNLGGPNPATFNVRLLYNETLIQSYLISNLPPWPNGLMNIIITWNTTGLTPYVQYILKAQADILEGETNTDNNIRTIIIGKVKMLGDVTGDKKINIFDVVSVTAVYRSQPGDPNWNVQADLKRDNKIDIYDVVMVCTRYGQAYP